MKRLVFMFLLALAACSGAEDSIFVDTPQCESIEQRYAEEPPQIVRVGLTTGGVATLLTVELANDQGKRSRGLMCRSEVPNGTGMLFDMGGFSSTAFWMFNTYVPLDIIYFDRSAAVVGTASMRPCPAESGEAEGDWRTRCLEESRAYAPDDDYTMALELPAGWLLTQGLTLSALPDDLRLNVFGTVNR